MNLPAPFDEKYISTLINSLNNEPNYICEQIAWELVEIGKPAVPALIGALKDKDSGVRYYAATTLGKIGDQRAIAPLYDILGDEDGEAWNGAAHALLKFGGLSVQKFIEMLEDKNRLRVRSAIFILGQLRDPQAIEPLNSILIGNEDKKLRWFAAAALGDIGDKEALLPLIESTQDAEKWVRYFAAEALDKLGDTSAINALLKLKQNDPDSDVKHIATEAIKRIKQLNS